MIKIVKKIFDYTFFRIAKVYFKRDGINNITALFTITLIIFLYLLSTYFVINEVFHFVSRGEITFLEKLLVVLIMTIIFFLVRKRYKGKYFSLRDRWINETKFIKVKNGILVILFILLPLIIVFIIAFYFGRTNF